MRNEVNDFIGRDYLPPLEKGAGGFNEGGACTMQNKSSVDEMAKSHPTFTL